MPFSFPLSPPGPNARLKARPVPASGPDPRALTTTLWREIGNGRVRPKPFAPAIRPPFQSNPKR